MIKLLSFADLHYCIEREKKCFAILDFVKKTALEIKPDFITISGDLQHKALVNSNTHGLPRLKAKLEDLATVAPIIIIYGTPSHDVPGSLGVFKSEMILICAPGEPLVFNQNKIAKNKHVIFYGIPEASKNMIIVGQDNIDQAGRDLNKELKNLCLSYGSHRKQKQGFQSVVLGHGIVKNTKTEKEKFVENATVYLQENDLAQIGADAYIWGDIHKPYDFETIKGGYTGSFAWDWNECDYKPRIHSYVIDGKSVKRETIYIPFIPERIKITDFAEIEFGLPVSSFSNKMVWIETEKETDITEDDLNKIGASPGSKVTIKPVIKKVIRSTEIAKAKTYREMFLLWNPEATEKMLQACDNLYEHDMNSGIVQEKKTITPLSTMIRGAKPFLEGIGKEEIFIDWTKYNPGLIGLIGPGGMGKSTLLDYMKPHVELLTQPNSLISTFELPDSYLENRYKVNDDIITLKIFIKATRKNPSAEYYAYVNDNPVQECNKNLSPFLEFVYKTFGTPRMFAVSVFRTQFDNPAMWKGAPLNPSIINADNATLKNIIHDFAGTDKSSAFSTAKATADKSKFSVDKSQNKLSGLKESIADIDIEKIKIDIGKESFDKKSTEVLISEKKLEIKESEKILDGLKKEYESSLTAEVNVSSAKRQISEIKNKITKHETSLLSLDNNDTENTVDELNEKLRILNIKLKSEVEKIKHNRQIDIAFGDKIEKYNADSKAYQEAYGKYEEQKKEIESKITKIDNHLRNIDSSISNTEEKIKILNDPCPNCGHVRSADEIKNLKLEIVDHKNEKRLWLSDKEEKIKEQQKISYSTPQPVYPERKSYLEVDNTVQPDIDKLKKNISDLEFNEKQIALLKSNVEQLKTEIIEHKKNIVIEEKKVIPFIKDKKETVENDFNKNKNSLLELEKKKIIIESTITNLNSSLENAKSILKKIKENESEIENHQNKYDLWSVMVKAWGRDGIPAMILENIAPEIDTIANELLEKYYPGLMIETSTLRKSSDGKKMIESFSINVINTETGRRKPLNCLSGEQRDFALTALYAAFRKMNEDNTGMIWNLSLDDEPDAHVSEEIMADFWNMKEQITNGTNRINVCISHSPEAKTRFDQTINILELV